MASSIYFYYTKESVNNQEVDSLVEMANTYGFEISNDGKKADIIICLGDDGVYLQGVRNTGFRSDCLYVGMTKENQSGLYSDFLFTAPREMFEALLSSNLQADQFPIINVSINDEAPFYCLNEASVRSSIIKTIAIDVYIDDTYLERFRGDGLIVATPTGSTGYNKSTQGAILDPTIPCFQMTEIASLNNNHYRTLGSSLVLSKGKKLRLEIIQDGNDYPIIGLDNEAYSIRNITDITVSMTDKYIQMIKLPDNNYWERIKRTFL
ncbi:putative inorganic polyphosphate/ATP-NAD kinase [Paraliobacillus sp. PM-2]|uniref:NAD kinase n=1 Tax=Paraliobacillus sp. PM-2 TaxID=1462524 RepID=UPI00061CD437|nr:putative inorganic polyphosphate/ATP-NAD kinase [Paraliobacillus sp. PM-2]